MIHVYDNVYIKVEADQYTVLELRVSEKENKEYTTNMSYFSTLAYAVANARSRYIRAGMSGFEGELKDAVEAFRKMDREFTVLMAEAGINC